MSAIAEEPVAPLLVAPTERHLTAVPSPADERVSVETDLDAPLQATLRVVGALDAATAAPLRAVLRSQVAAGRRFLRLDLSAVTSVEPEALTAVARAHQELLARRGTLVLSGVRDLVDRGLRAAGLDSVLFVSGPRGLDRVGQDGSTFSA